MVAVRRNRYLFCCCFQPVLADIRSWIYSTTEEVSVDDLGLPEFLQPLQDALNESGEQLRVMSEISTETKVEEAIVHSIRHGAEIELLEITRICRQLGDSWAFCDTGFNDVGVNRWIGAVQSHVPMPFTYEALHEVSWGRFI